MNSEITLLNQTANTLSYVDGQVSVPGNGSANIPYGLIPYLVLDGNFIADLRSIPPNVVVSDGVNQYSRGEAWEYLSLWLNAGPAQNSSDPVAFTLAGKGFSTTANVSLNSSTETAVLLLSNPSNSPVNARAIYFYAAPNSTQGIVTVSIYTNPTVTSNGSAISIQNNLVSSTSPSSSLNAYGGPTTSSFGTKSITMVTNANADTSLFNFAQTAILTPGNSMLMTVSVSNLGLLSSVNTYFYLQWVEA